ncbi:MAG: heme biosynthesis HemY N-terminal domain-containing protein [Rubrivivax sp.]
MLVVGSCFLLMSAAQALNSLLSLPRRAGEWRALQRERAAQAALREALAEYFGARYSRAHKAATRALAIQADSATLRGDAEFTALGHLLAAGSLHRLQDRAKRDEQIASLTRTFKRGSAGRSAEDGARLLAAEWALDDRDAARALQFIAELPPGVARRAQALRLKLQANRMARQPLEALHTARLLANHQAFSPTAAQGLLRSLAIDALEGAHDVQQLRRLWEQFDAADRRDPLVAARAALRAVALDAPAEARAWLRPYWERLQELSRDEREQVALALMAACEGLGTDWLPRIEAALSAFGHEPAVVAAAGTAFAERQLWGKARRLLQQAGAAPGLPGATRRRAWRLLARLAESEGDAAERQRCEHEAAAID